MNQAELINAINAKGISKSISQPVLETLALVIKAELQKGGEVTLPGIGKFSTDLRAARTGRNPKTGAEIAIAEKRVPKFSASKSLKEAVMMENSHG